MASSSVSRLKRAVSSPYLQGLAKSVAGNGEDDEPATPLPKGQIAVVFFNQMNIGVQVMMPFTLLVYIVADMDVSKGGSPDLVGSYTGYLSCLFNVGGMFTSMAWGKFSDRYGRKPVVLISCLSAAAGAIGLGITDNYLLVCGVRLFSGAMNGVIGAIKCICGEITDHTNQARGFSLIALAWGIGSIVGPVLSGILAVPCAPDHLLHGTHLCVEGALFQRRPYMLACLAMAMHSFAAFVFSLVVLDETLNHAHLKKKGAAAGEVGAGEGGGELSEEEKRSVELETRGLLAGEDDDSPRAADGPGVAWDTGPSPPPPKPSQPSDLNVSFEELELSPLPPMKAEEGAAGLPGGVGESTARAGAGGAGGAGGAVGGDIEAGAVGGESGCSGEDGHEGEGAPILGGGGGGREGAGGGEAEAEAVGPHWWNWKYVPQVIQAYGMVAFLFILIEEVVPIYAAAAPEVGGLGLMTADLSGPMATGGAFLFAYSLIVFPWTERKFGVMPLARSASLFATLMVLGFPLCSVLQGGHPGLARALFYVTSVMKNMAGTNLFTPSVLMVNAASPPGKMGAVNGVGQTAAAVVRAIGPAMGGAMWSASIHTGLPFHQFMPFGVMSACGVVLFFMFTRSWTDELQARIIKNKAKNKKGGGGGK